MTGPKITTATPYEPPRLTGRKPKLSREQAMDAVRRYELHQRHHPLRIASDLGVSLTTLREYLAGAERKHWK